MRKAIGCTLFTGLMLLGCGCEIAWAEGSADLGLGIGWSDSGGTGASDIVAGYKAPVSEGWSRGGDLHVLDSGAFASTSLYATAQSDHPWLHMLQFQAGLVHARSGRDKQIEPVRWSGTGVVVGMGLVTDISENIQVHLLDVRHGFVAGHSFNTFSINFLIAVAAIVKMAP